MGANAGMVHSSPSSGIFFQGDVQSQPLGNLHLSSFGNSVPVSRDITSSVGASSMVTDANSGGLSGGPHLQRSASANNESYMRLPASPLSFTSNNMSISGSSVIDGPSNMQTGSTHSLPCQGASTATSLPPGSTVLGSFIQDNDNISPLQKKPRLDMKQEDIMQQQVVQQILQRQDSMHLQSSNPQLQTLIQQQRLRQQLQLQQQLLQSLPPVQRAHLLQQQQQLQLRQQLQQQSMQPANAMKRPYDGGVCSRRLMQYLYHQRQWPADNGISYWRKFVAEYYSPRAKQRWCLSLYDNVGHHSLGVFPQATIDAWQCDICGSKSGRGFEATFEVLPRLNEIKFSSGGVLDELLFLDMPREFRLPSGIMVLEYGKAVQESIYEQLRVVREGQLKIVFTPDLKILTWEFCARRHEELLPRRLVAPQVNQLLQVAQKCQSTIVESGCDGVSQQDLQTNSNMVVASVRQLARSLELQSLNDLGFSKRYVRCLQISEVVNSMRDLMDFCRDTRAGPIEGLKSFPRKTKSQTQQQEISSKLLNPGANNVQYHGTPLAHSNYQNMLMRQSQQEASSSSSSFNRFQPRPMFQQSPNGIQQQMIQQLLQDVNSGPKPSISGQSGSMGGDGLRYGISSSSVTSPRPPVVPTRSNSFKGSSHNESSEVVGNDTDEKTDLTHLCDDMVLDIGNGFFDHDELEEGMGYDWKS